MEEQRCEFCVWFDPEDCDESTVNYSWCNKWEAPVASSNFCGWYVPNDN